MEELHLERWAVGLSPEIFQKLCDEMGVVLDGGINRWAVTGLGILLAEGDLDSANHADAVRSDLKTLQITRSEQELILTLVREYPAAEKNLLRESFPFPPFCAD
jgi:hypothetical protein